MYSTRLKEICEELDECSGIQCTKVDRGVTSACNCLVWQLCGLFFREWAIVWGCGAAWKAYMICRPRKVVGLRTWQAQKI
jgi:hypothetical protein